MLIRQLRVGPKLSKNGAAKMLLLFEFGELIYCLVSSRHFPKRLHVNLLCTGRAATEIARFRHHEKSAIHARGEPARHRNLARQRYDHVSCACALRFLSRNPIELESESLVA